MYRRTMIIRRTKAPSPRTGRASRTYSIQKELTRRLPPGWLLARLPITQAKTSRAITKARSTRAFNKKSATSPYNNETHKFLAG